MSDPHDDDGARGASAAEDDARYDTARRRARELVDELLSETGVEPPLGEVTALLDVPVTPRASSPAVALAELRDLLGRVSAPVAAAIAAVAVAEAAAARVEPIDDERARSEAPTGGAETGDEDDDDDGTPGPVERSTLAVPPPPPEPAVAGPRTPRRAAVTPRVTARPRTDEASIEIVAGEPPAIVIDAGEPPPRERPARAISDVPELSADVLTETLDEPAPVPEARRVLPPPLPPADDSPFAADEPGDLRQAAELAITLDASPLTTEIGPRPEPDAASDDDAPTGPGDADEETPFGEAPATELGSDLGAALARAETEPPSEISVRIEHPPVEPSPAPALPAPVAPGPARRRPGTPRPADPRAMWAAGDARPLPVHETEEESSSVTSVDPNEEVVELEIPPEESVHFERLAMGPQTQTAATAAGARPLVPHRASLGAEELEPTDLARLGQVTGGLDDDEPPIPTPPPRPLPAPKRRRPPTEIEITVEDDEPDEPPPALPPPPIPAKVRKR